MELVTGARTARRRRRKLTVEGLPAEGDLVEVRGQNWIVSHVAPAWESDEPPATSGPIEPGTIAPAATIVHLQSVADGRYGETLSVAWEVEPGRRVLPASSLPDVSAGKYDPPERLAAFLDAIRWSAVASADVKNLQAPFRSGIAIEPYQLEPVSRAVGAPRVNLLLADDVGLGKTVEAGLVAQELLLRGRAHRIMVVSPAGLTIKWRDELAEKFGLDFTVVDSARCAELRRTHGTTANPFRVHPLTIVSLPWLRGAKAQRLLDEVIPSVEATGDQVPGRFFDLLILDEAHHVAPSAPKQVYAVDSQQTKLIRRMVPHFEHRLFLSATPHNGYRESYTALLELIDNQRFARGVNPDEQAVKETVVRRLKSSITRPDGTPYFRRRETREMPVRYTDEERRIHELLTAYADLRRERMAPGAKGGRKATDLVVLLLKKRLFSSPAAFGRTVQVYLENIAAASKTVRPRTAAADVPDWLNDFADEIADLDDVDLAEAEDDALGRTTRLTPGPTEDESDLLGEMLRWAETHEARADSKAAALTSYLKAVTHTDGRHWSNERVVVFTEYRDTQDWLLGLLRQEGMAEKGRIELLHGGLSVDERERIRLGFQAHPAEAEGAVRVLIATDAASEGIDLQKHCHRLVNYDIPFNPNKLEQRIGRIDRWGQRHDPEVRHFVGEDWQKAKAGSFEADLEFLSRIAKKVALMEEDLGEVNAVLADAVLRRMSGDQRHVDIENAKARKINGRNTGGTVEAEQNVTDQVRRLSAGHDRTVDELGITPGNIARVVTTALALDRQQPLRPVRDLHHLHSGTGDELRDVDLDNSFFEVPQLGDYWERATRGLAHKLRPRDRRPVTFDPRVAGLGRDDIVLAHLKHPLVDLSTRLLRAAAWNAEQIDLHRVSAVVSDDPHLETTLVSAYARYVLIGADGVRLHEEVLHAGGWLNDAGWLRRWDSVNTQRETLGNALNHGVAAAEHLRTRLTRSWPRVQDRLMASLEARAKERRESLDRALRQRREEEEHRINANLDRFESTLRAKVDENAAEGDEQLVLWEAGRMTPAERRQYQLDREHLQRRLDVLGVERRRELAAIDARYSDLTSHLFPAAVVFVIPRKEAVR
ncbi:DISARM system SNF2-like helicase DrmD [Saccharothrix lopnurensis]|uniref:DISARM system SNF2-like helicase DrmD n=1 Tax=Saccharothrix lopnurensis TaxID=1670621 RepID=A0ABW1PE43_9PSEU